MGGNKQDDSAIAGAAYFHVLRVSESATGKSTCIGILSQQYFTRDEQVREMLAEKVRNLGGRVVEGITWEVANHSK